jgi:hypothetical protein
MTLDEELKMHLDKLATCKAELKLAQEIGLQETNYSMTGFKKLLALKDMKANFTYLKS